MAEGWEGEAMSSCGEDTSVWKTRCTVHLNLKVPFAHNADHKVLCSCSCHLVFFTHWAWIEDKLLARSCVRAVNMVPAGKQQLVCWGSVFFKLLYLSILFKSLYSALAEALRTPSTYSQSNICLVLQALHLGDSGCHQGQPLNKPGFHPPWLPLRVLKSLLGPLLRCVVRNSLLIVKS
jgi:hypothetical protein